MRSIVLTVSSLTKGNFLEAALLFVDSVFLLLPLLPVWKRLYIAAVGV